MNAIGSMLSTRRESYRQLMTSLLRLRKDRRYRRGVIQMAVMADVISHGEWESLARQIDQRVEVPRLPGLETE